MKMHLLDPAPPLSQLDPATPPAVSALVASMLAKSAGERPSMTQVLAALMPFDAASAPLPPPPAATETGRALSPLAPVPPASPEIIDLAATEVGSAGRRPQVADATAARASAASKEVTAETTAAPQAPVPAAAASSSPPRRRPWGLLALTFVLGAGVGASAAGVLFLRALRPPAAAPAIAAKPAVAWTRVDGGTTENLYAVWGADAKDIWAVGSSGQAIHYDGTAWQHVSLPFKSPQVDSLRAIWGSSRDDIWVAGKAGVMFHYDGGKWSEVATGTDQNLYCIWGLSSTNWWTGGRQGVLLHSDGKELLPVDVPTKQQIRSIWASAPDDLWVAAASDANEGTIPNENYGSPIRTYTGPWLAM